MTPDIMLLAVGSALVLTAIDVVFVIRGVIDRVYLADAAELLLVGWWVIDLAGGNPARAGT